MLIFVRPKKQINIIIKHLNILIMKGFTKFIVLIFSLFTFFPMIFMLFDLIINGRESFLNELVDGMFD